VTVPVPGDVPQGTYLVSYRVISADGHPVSGALTYSVGSPSAVPPASACGTPDRDRLRGPATPVRYSAYAGLVLRAGAAGAPAGQVRRVRRPGAPGRGGGGAGPAVAAAVVPDRRRPPAVARGRAGRRRRRGRRLAAGAVHHGRAGARRLRRRGRRRARDHVRP